MNQQSQVQTQSAGKLSLPGEKTLSQAAKLSIKISNMYRKKRKSHCKLKFLSHK